MTGYFEKSVCICAGGVEWRQGEGVWDNGDSKERWSEWVREEVKGKGRGYEPHAEFFCYNRQEMICLSGLDSGLWTNS